MTVQWSAIAGVKLKHRGDWDASFGSYPLAPRYGDWYTVVIAGTLTDVLTSPVTVTIYAVDDHFFFDGNTWRFILSDDGSVPTSDEILNDSTVTGATISNALETLATDIYNNPAYGGTWDIDSSPSLPTDAVAGRMYQVIGAAATRDGVNVTAGDFVIINDDGTTISNLSAAGSGDIVVDWIADPVAALPAQVSAVGGTYDQLTQTLTVSGTPAQSAAAVNAGIPAGTIQGAVALLDYTDTINSSFSTQCIVKPQFNEDTGGPGSTDIAGTLFGYAPTTASAQDILDMFGAFFGMNPLDIPANCPFFLHGGFLSGTAAVGASAVVGMQYWDGTDTMNDFATWTESAVTNIEVPVTFGFGTDNAPAVVLQAASTGVDTSVEENQMAAFLLDSAISIDGTPVRAYVIAISATFGSGHNVANQTAEFDFADATYNPLQLLAGSSAAAASFVQADYDGVFGTSNLLGSNSFPVLPTGEIIKAISATSPPFTPYVNFGVTVTSGSVYESNEVDTLQELTNNTIGSDDVPNDSTVTGASVSDALETNDAAATANALAITNLGSDAVANDSTVTGAAVSDALETNDAAATANALAITNLGSDDVANDSTVAGASVSDALEATQTPFIVYDDASKTLATALSEATALRTLLNVPRVTILVVDDIVVSGITAIPEGVDFIGSTTTATTHLVNAGSTGNYMTMAFDTTFEGVDFQKGATTIGVHLIEIGAGATLHLKKCYVRATTAGGRNAIGLSTEDCRLIFEDCIFSHNGASIILVGSPLTLDPIVEFRGSLDPGDRPISTFLSTMSTTINDYRLRNNSEVLIGGHGSKIAVLLSTNFSSGTLFNLTQAGGMPDEQGARHWVTDTDQLYIYDGTDWFPWNQETVAKTYDPEYFTTFEKGSPSDELYFPIGASVTSTQDTVHDFSIRGSGTQLFSLTIANGSGINFLKVSNMTIDLLGGGTGGYTASAQELHNATWKESRTGGVTKGVNPGQTHGTCFLICNSTPANNSFGLVNNYGILTIQGTGSDGWSLTTGKTINNYGGKVTLGTDSIEGVGDLTINNFGGDVVVNSQANHSGSVIVVDAVALNTAKVTNVPTALSIGTKTATTMGITSDGGADDVILPAVSATEAGLMTAAEQVKLGNIDQGIATTDSPTFDGITITGPSSPDISITDVLDEDDMVSDSDTALATQQSIKAYVGSATTVVHTTGAETVAGIKTLSNDLYSNSNLVIDKTSGLGIKVDTAAPTYAWNDIIGEIQQEEGGPGAPTLTAYRGGIKQFQFGVADEVFIEFHMPHDYAPGTDVFIHAHWSHNDVSSPITTGDVTWGFEVTWAKGFDQAAFIAPITLTATETATDSYRHMITETQLSIAGGGSPAIIDTTDLEPDGVFLVRAYLSASTLTGAIDPFLHFVDIHYQTTNIGTKQKAPNFYV